MAVIEFPGLIEEASKCLSTEMLDMATVRRWMIGRLHPDGVRCPSCGMVVANTDRKRFRCAMCGKWFGLWTGTVLEGSKIDERAVYLIAVFLGLNMEISVIAERLGISGETIRFWRRRLR